MPKQDERPRSARRIVATCTDNLEVEGQLSVGTRYEVQAVTRYGSDAYYKLRNDSGDLASYGTHRFDTRVETWRRLE